MDDGGVLFLGRDETGFEYVSLLHLGEGEVFSVVDLGTSTLTHIKLRILTFW